MMQHKALDEQDESSQLAPTSSTSYITKAKSAPPSVWLQRYWFVCLFFSVVYMLVAIISADDNHKSKDGTKALGFSAIWTAGILCVVVVFSAFVVFKGGSSAHHIGLLIGTTGMLSQLFFMLMIVFFVYGEHASSQGHDVKDTDNAMGSFCLFSALVFSGWTALLFIFKDDIITKSAASRSNEKYFSEDMDESARLTESAVAEEPPRMSTQDESNIAGDMEADEVVDIDLEEDGETF